MQEFFQRLSENRTNPRLWFERLVIFREPDQEHFIRSVTFQRGLNLVWAKEPAPGSEKGVRAAGHGVGKTSLCLLLRYCLGDSARTVSELRDELFEHFPQGGVAVVLHLEDEAYSIYRSFNPYVEGQFSAGRDIEQLLREKSGQAFKTFEQQLADSILANTFPRQIPDTGQSIEWRHVLAWMTRDQGSRFKSFFAWREGEGTGLQRSRQDPPIVMRTLLGLMEQAESDLMTDLAKLELDRVDAEKQVLEIQREPEVIRRRIESNLRAWCGLPDALPMYSDDLFKDSVAEQIRLAEQQAKDKLAAMDAQYDVLQQELADIRVEEKELTAQSDKAGLLYDIAEAARRNDEEAYRSIAEKLLNLAELPGQCEHASIEFQRCTHIQAEIQRLQMSADLKDGRDKKALESAMADAAATAVAALGRKTQLDGSLKEVSLRLERKNKDYRKARLARDSLVVDAGRGEQLLSELERWQRSAGSDEATAEIAAAEAKSETLKRDADSARVRLNTLQSDRSSREKHLSELMEILTRELLDDGAFGCFDSRDESRPFRLSMRGGEAYRVLEVLLGDLTCLVDSGNRGSDFPGFVIHDCPREADMSSGLYENYLLLVERIQKECFGNEPPFQYIVTTTTPPPAFRDKQYLRLELDPSKDDGLLFKQRMQ